MTNNEAVFYSVEQVAERLGLHVRTVRSYVRDGRLRAVRIGKQYRIAQQDLDALTARPSSPAPAIAAGPAIGPAAGTATGITAAYTTDGPATVEVTSVVQVDAVDSHLAERLSTYLIAGGQMSRDLPRIQTTYDRDRRRLTIVILGAATATADILHIIDAIVGRPDGAPDA
jgi:excisionase family DNA binding protein